MAVPAYSHTFFQLSQSGVYAIYTVPDKKRAIVRTLFFTNTGTTNGDCLVELHGKPLWYPRNTGPGTLIVTGLTVVAYQHETIRASFSGGVTGVVTVAGYVFDDPGGAGGPPGTTNYALVREGEVLPAGSTAWDRDIDAVA